MPSVRDRSRRFRNYRGVRVDLWSVVLAFGELSHKLLAKASTWVRNFITSEISLASRARALLHRNALEFGYHQARARHLTRSVAFRPNEVEDSSSSSCPSE